MLLREAFAELLRTPRPVSVARLANRLGRSASDLEPLIARLDERGWLRRDYDTLGIFAALGAGGRIRSRTPLEEPVELEVVAGRPRYADGVLPARTGVAWAA